MTATSVVGDDSNFKTSSGKLKLKLGPENAHDYVTCFGKNAETGSTFKKEVELG